MTAELFTQLLEEFAVLGGLLLIGTLLRAKVKLFQNLFLPAAVIGGFIGLLLGPIVMKSYAILPIPESFIKDFSLLPGIMVAPIFIALPLGMGMDKSPTDAKRPKNSILPMFFLAWGCSAGLFTFGFIVNAIFSKLMPELNIYPAFGIELSIGFVAGHGTAGLIGNVFQNMGVPYWEVSQGVAVTAATVGLIGGIVIGMIMINVAARKKQITHLDRPSDIPAEIKKGYLSDVSSQEKHCRETTHTSSIDSMTFHIAIIMAVCGLAYGLTAFLKFYKVPVLSFIFAWAWGIVLMMIVNAILKKLNLSFMIDTKVRDKFTSVLVDFAIVAAIASLPVEMVLKYMTPMIVMFIGGFIWVYLILMVIGKTVFKDFKFERSIILFGQNTGVAMTGILLLRICDPDMKTPAMRDFTIAYAMSAMAGFIILLPMLKLINNTAATILLNGVITVFALIVALLLGRFAGRKTDPDQQSTP